MSRMKVCWCGRLPLGWLESINYREVCILLSCPRWRGLFTMTDYLLQDYCSILAISKSESMLWFGGSDNYTIIQKPLWSETAWKNFPYILKLRWKLVSMVCLLISFSHQLVILLLKSQVLSLLCISMTNNFVSRVKNCTSFTSQSRKMFIQRKPEENGIFTDFQPVKFTCI